MGLRRTYQKMITAFRGGWEGMAGCLGMTVAGLENHVYEKKGQCMSVRLALLIQEFSGTTHFAEAVAIQSGGMFVKHQDFGEMDRQDLLAKFNELYAELGELSRKFHKYTQDDKLDKKERDDLSEIGRHIHEKVEVLLALAFHVYCPKDKAASVEVSRD